MLPKLVVYNSVSIDCAITDFNANVPLHYQVLCSVGVDALLAGSATAKSGIKQVYQTVPPEEPSDFQKPAIEPNDQRLLWVIADSRGALEGLLHVHRKSGYTKDIVVLVSKATPQHYLTYLATRNYDFIIAGDDHVDYRLALEQLNKRYGIEAIATDTGGVLVSHLLDAGLVDEVHLLVAPEIVGEKVICLFRSLRHAVPLELLECKQHVQHCGHILFE